MLILLFSFIPTFFFYSEWLDFGDGYGIVWFIVLYYVSSYIRNYRYKKEIMGNNCTFLNTSIILKISYIRYYISIDKKIVGSSLFYSNNSIIILISSIFTFLSFLTIEVKNSILERSSLFFGKCTLGVYLIHDNDFIRSILWRKIKPYLSCHF